MWDYYRTMQCLFHTTPGQICSAAKCRGVLTSFTHTHTNLPSDLWHCWLYGRKGIRPVKTERWGAGVVVCLEWNADLHMAQLMPLPLTVSCFSKIQTGFTFLVPAHLGSPGQRAVKRVCVCVLQILVLKTSSHRRRQNNKHKAVLPCSKTIVNE